MRFVGTCYRAHDPRWAFKPISGDGAAIRGARFNPKGVPALYLALSLENAVREINQGFGAKIEPCVLCSYEVDCDDIADLRSDDGRRGHGVKLDDMACAWFSFLADGREPPSWDVYRKLAPDGFAGALVPSFAIGSVAGDDNLVLWAWSDSLPHRVHVHDPSDRLPRDQLSWG